MILIAAIIDHYLIINRCRDATVGNKPTHERREATRLMMRRLDPDHRLRPATAAGDQTGHAEIKTG